MKHQFWKVVHDGKTLAVYDDYHDAYTVAEDMGEGYEIMEATYYEFRTQY